MFLPNVNLWLALAFDSHFHHAAANAWFERSSDRFSFCRMTQQGFLRLASDPRVFKEETVSLKQAWRMYDAIMSDPRVVFTAEPENLERFWRQYTQRRTYSSKVWNDAYLAAFARAAVCKLVTFDKGFN